MTASPGGALVEVARGLRRVHDLSGFLGWGCGAPKGAPFQSCDGEFVRSHTGVLSMKLFEKQMQIPIRLRSGQAFDSPPPGSAPKSKSSLWGPRKRLGPRSLWMTASKGGALARLHAACAAWTIFQGFWGGVAARVNSCPDTKRRWGVCSVAPRCCCLREVHLKNKCRSASTHHPPAEQRLGPRSLWMTASPGGGALVEVARGLRRVHDLSRFLGWGCGASKDAPFQSCGGEFVRFPP